jgi:cytochrome c oxidase cbb3-type subunit 3
MNPPAKFARCCAWPRGVVVVAAWLSLAGCGDESGRAGTPPRDGEASGTGMVRLGELIPGGGSSQVEPMPNPLAGDAAAVAEGRRLFDWYNCSGCHAGGGGGMGPPLMDTTWIYGSRPRNIHHSIVSGRPNGMPSFGAHIPDHQVWQLVSFIESLGGTSGGGDDADARSSRSD